MRRFLNLFVCTLSFLVYSFQLSAQISVSYTESNGSFPVVKAETAAAIVLDPNDAEVVGLAAASLSNDIKMITNSQAPINQGISTGYPIVIGTLGNSVLIDALADEGKISTDDIAGEWETFCITLINNPFEGVEQALVIYGSDPRGTAFGVFEFSKLLGVSPWVWWADVVPEQHAELFITSGGESIYGPPSIQYRGIFLNDEDWGLQPWAAEHMDTDVKDIGPQTYAKIFELMLRCKANYIWPAMHPSTKAFWYYDGNPEMARKYQIVLGSSHAEPMLRNNVDEWSNNFVEEYGYAPGSFNWATNSEQMKMYWGDRAAQSKNNDAIYTMGIRGIHDSRMEGYNSNAERAVATKEVINVQRSILADSLGRPVTEIPQMFCPYKEALDLYRIGIDLAEDVTLLWVDDNYGYIRQLSNPEEQMRSGGSGVYYHFSYWGWPEDYLWLSTISPSLASYELMKAYHMGADKIWIVNVGDIKPNEMEMQFAMDLAWDVNSWTPDKAHLYAAHWAEETFGSSVAESIAEIKAQFYKLAATGKPEQLHDISFSEQEMLQRIQAYDSLMVACDKVKAQIPARLQDAFYQLIEYPVKGSAHMNTKILGAKLSHLYAGQGLEKGLDFANRAIDAYSNIVSLTEKYNNDVASGKWYKMMDYAPRGLGHFYDPSVATVVNNSSIPEANSDTMIVMAASDYSGENAQGYQIQTFEGLGSEGSAVGVWPLNLTTYTASDVSSAPYVEYEVPVTEGLNKIGIRCLPNFPLYEAKQLRFAVSLEGAEPEFINIETQAETGGWASNILRGYAKGELTYANEGNETVSLRVYLTDPGLVISGISSTGVTESKYTAMLKNPNFELKAEGVYNDGSTVRGIPYGWLSAGNLTGNSFGINSDGANLSGSNLCWINSNPLPENYELYQIIPKDSLVPGEYIVRCRLAAITSDQARVITTQRLFANNTVQYFASESAYGSNLTEGEVNTFAAYTPSRAYDLKEMALKIAVFEGDSLKVGIRSSNKTSSGSAATDNAGWFKVDHFRIELVREFEDISNDLNNLDSLIQIAVALRDSTEAGNETGQYPAENRNDLENAINQASEVHNKQGVTLQEVLDETISISQAIETYKKSVLTWNRLINNHDFEYKAEGILNDGSTVRGIPYGWESSGGLTGNSFGINNDGVNYNKNNLCWINATPMPDDYELYQIIHKDSLTAGEYIVRCRLAVMTDRVTNQRLFANNTVQYFGSEADYVSNIAENETYTFAGWEPAGSYMLKEMEVSVQLEEDDSLKIGIRSGNLLSDGSRASSNNSGWFKVDYFRLEKVHVEDTTVNNNTIFMDKSRPEVSITNAKGGFYVNLMNTTKTGHLWLYTKEGRLLLQSELNGPKTQVQITRPDIYIAKIVLNGTVYTHKIFQY